MTAAAAADIVLASRILARLGVVDAFGHVSCRHPERPDWFLLSRSLAPARVTAQDVLTLDLAGKAVVDDTRPLFLERFIHAELYRARPEVGAVVHAHAPQVLPFTIVPGVAVLPVCHMCGFLAGTREPFDLADHGGDGTDLLVACPEHGRALAAHSGEAAVVLMRGHGFTAVGASIRDAVFRAVYTVRNCEIQAAALALGQPVYLSDAEAAACERTTAAQANRAWDLWADAVGAPILHQQH